MAVSFTGWVKSHLAITRIDYSEDRAFVLAYGNDEDLRGK